MKDSPVAWLNCLIDRGRILYVEGVDVRTPNEGKEWQECADRFAEEARAGVKARSPDDAARLGTLSPYPRMDLPIGHPWRTPPPSVLDTIAPSTSSVKCGTNNPVSYHWALVDELKEIVSDWRIELPGKPIGRFQYGVDAKRDYSEHVISTREATGRAPTEAEDVAWGVDHGLKRIKVRELRKNSPDRTAKDRRDTNPAKK
ncbi:MAG: hypothetical protein O6924_07025 [Alphaproteobacteria bacterium]|nr:hypothetical protein [Alphaproteobacteria bacterium]